MLEADLQREYSVDLLDLWRGRMSMRKLAVLVRGLGPDSATVRAASEVPDEFAGWSMTDILLGRLVNEASFHRWEWGLAHTEDKRRSSYPKPPRSVLPEADKGAANASAPVISPRHLGSFLNIDNEGAPGD